MPEFYDRSSFLPPLLTRKAFFRLVALLGAGFSARRTKAATAATTGPKILLVVAHPDDEYTFAATVYRLARELGATVDQVVVTNGEGGFKYASLAENIYGVSLTDEAVGRAALPAIRKRETLAAGKLLGIRKHYFLDQKDTGYTLDAAEAWNAWDRAQVVDFLTALLRREQYEFVFTLIPTAETHGHHQAATVLALEAVAQLPESERPAVLGGDPFSAAVPVPSIPARHTLPLTDLWDGPEVFIFDRRQQFGYHASLNYQIVVNWVIAEHKTQGLFQTDANKHELEHFWLFRTGSPDSLRRTQELFRALTPHPKDVAASPSPQSFPVR